MIKWIILLIVFLVLPTWLRVIMLVLVGIFIYTRKFKFVPDESQFSLFFGLPGSGKTTVLSDIVRQCNKRKSCTVLTNFPVSGAYEVRRSDLGVFDISPEAFGTKECVLVFDEASIDYFKRDYESFSKNENKFHSMHRHAKVHEVFACQSWDGMDKRLRELNTKLYYVDKWYFKLIRIRTISKDFNINEEKQPIEGYEFEPLSTKFVYAPKVWHMFDTFDRSVLPTRKKEWKYWFPNEQSKIESESKKDEN